MEVLHRLAKEDKGFAGLFGKGIKKMKAYFIENYNLTPEQEKFIQDIGMEHKGLEYSEYITKESLAQQGGYGFTLKGPQHDEAWLIFLDQVHNYMPTFEDKANALAWFPYWRHTGGHGSQYKDFANSRGTMWSPQTIKRLLNLTKFLSTLSIMLNCMSQ